MFALNTAEKFIRRPFSVASASVVTALIGRLHYKLEPVVDLRTKSNVGVELLRGNLALMPSFCWHRWYANAGHIHRHGRADHKLFVNLHSHQLLDRVLVNQLMANIGAESLVLEWTEYPCKPKQLHHAAEVLKSLRREYRVQICVDDFGAGADGIERINLVKPDIVKIDGRILHLARQSRIGTTLLRNMVHLISDFGATSVIEWIETERDLDIAIATGANYGQGYLWPGAVGSI